MNPLSEHLHTGTVGELLVQLRLLQYHVQAAPPLKDTGNDLIAIKGDVFKAIQVKTTTNRQVRWEIPNRRFHLLGLVRLEGGGNQLHLDRCDVYLVPKEDLGDVRELGTLDRYRLTAELVERLFTDQE
jgi:hypothetical protein